MRLERVRAYVIGVTVVFAAWCCAVGLITNGYLLGLVVR